MERKEELKQFTAKVVTDKGDTFRFAEVCGSCFLVDSKIRGGMNVYRALTNHHVVYSASGNFGITTHDHKIHPAHCLANFSKKGLDLAVLEFETTKTYPIAKLEKSSPFLCNSTVDFLGFPFSDLTFRIERGKIFRMLNFVWMGYKIATTVETSHGMSGGPVLDCDVGSMVFCFPPSVPQSSFPKSLLTPSRN
jgi:S1-C subfamily serine protease